MHYTFPLCSTIELNNFCRFSYCTGFGLGSYILATDRIKKIIAVQPIFVLWYFLLTFSSRYINKHKRFFLIFSFIFDAFILNACLVSKLKKAVPVDI